MYTAGMPLGLLKKVGKYRGIGGLGAQPPAGSRGSALVGVQARAFSQSELPRKPPIDTHGRYTYNTCTKKRKKSRNVRKSRNSDKSWKNGIPDTVTKDTILFCIGVFGRTRKIEYDKVGVVRFLNDHFVESYGCVHPTNVTRIPAKQME